MNQTLLLAGRFHEVFDMRNRLLLKTKRSILEFIMLKHRNTGKEEEVNFVEMFTFTMSLKKLLNGKLFKIIYIYQTKKSI